MLRYIALLFLATFFYEISRAQRLITKDDAVNLTLNNQRNSKAGNLAVLQQQQMVNGIAGLDNPQVQAGASPYEPLVVGVQQTLSLPSVYRKRKALQNERIRLAQLQLQGSQYELKRAVRFSYFQLQYYSARIALLTYQDSVYQAIKTASKRFFEAGQINKLEELQASSQADRVHNELVRAGIDLTAEIQIFRFYTNLTDSFFVEPLQTFVFISQSDTISNSIQQQVLQQQIIINQRELALRRSELLPQFTAGLSFPTTKDYIRPVGFQLGITLPIWRKQNRAFLNAAQTGIGIAQAEQELELQRLHANYRQALSVYQKEQQSLSYFNNTALPQAKAIIETAQRLFQGGELNYIESLRNLQTAFDIFNDHLETHKAYNESVIVLYYLNQTL